MNQPFKIPLFQLCRIGLIAGICLLSCKGQGDKKDDRNEAVLEKPPFAALTDSIRQSSPAQAARLYLRRGDLLSQNNMHEMAADDYKRSWDVHPDDGVGLRYASTLSIIGRTDEAVRVLQDCLKKFPANGNIAGLLGDIYVQSGRMELARVLYNNLLAADSTNFEAWYEKGILSEKTKDTADAITSLKKAWSLQPVNTYALELAHLYAEQGNNSAISLCNEVLRKDSTDQLVDPFFIKGIYYSNTGQNGKAVTEFDSCIKRDWKFTDAYIEKGIIFFHQKKYDQAQDVFQMATTVSNTYPDAYYWLGRCYEVKGKKDQAIIYYQQAVALDKDFSEARARIDKLKG
jgi:tetratricopeptide (TPR) repeat protein